MPKSEIGIECYDLLFRNSGSELSLIEDIANDGLKVSLLCKNTFNSTRYRDIKSTVREIKNVIGRYILTSKEVLNKLYILLNRIENMIKEEIKWELNKQEKLLRQIRIIDIRLNLLDTNRTLTRDEISRQKYDVLLPLMRKRHAMVQGMIRTIKANKKYLDDVTSVKNGINVCMENNLERLH